MSAIAYLPIVSSLSLLGAHFFRAGSMPALAAVAGLMILLAIRKPWAARCVQAGLAFGVVEWLRTFLVLAIERMHAGAPYQRMLVILGAVTLITALAALLFQTRPLDAMYGLRTATGPDQVGTDTVGSRSGIGGNGRAAAPHQPAHGPE
jgi:hypothetical protein